MKKCPYCECETNDFVLANQNVSYSGIEISINRQGLLRVRTYINGVDDYFDSQDIIEIKYCPLCGKKFNKSPV